MWVNCDHNTSRTRNWQNILFMSEILKYCTVFCIYRVYNRYSFYLVFIRFLCSNLFLHNKMLFVVATRRSSPWRACTCWAYHWEFRIECVAQNWLQHSKARSSDQGCQSLPTEGSTRGPHDVRFRGINHTMLYKIMLHS